MYWELFKQAARLTSSLTEFGLIFNSWIISPSHPFQPTGTYLPHPATCAALYAVFEPLCSLVIPQSPLMPFITLLCTGMAHFLLFSWMVDTWDFVAAQQSLASRVRYSATRKPDPRTHQSRAAPQSNNLAVQTSPTLPITALATATAHIFFTAASNASLMAFSTSLSATGFEGEVNVYRWLSVFAYIFYLLSGMADYLTSTKTSRAIYLGQQGIAIGIRQLLNLVLLHGVRIAVRKILSMPVFETLEVRDQAEVEMLYGPQRYARAVEIMRQLPKWLPFVLMALAVASLWFSQWFTNRARTRRR